MIDYIINILKGIFNKEPIEEKVKDPVEKKVKKTAKKPKGLIKKKTKKKGSK
jgi:hypothetical protein